MPQKHREHLKFLIYVCLCMCHIIGIKYVENRFKAVKQQRTLNSRVSKSMFIVCCSGNTWFVLLRDYLQGSGLTESGYVIVP